MNNFKRALAKARRRKELLAISKPSVFFSYFLINIKKDIVGTRYQVISQSSLRLRTEGSTPLRELLFRYGVLRALAALREDIVILK